MSKLFSWTSQSAFCRPWHWKGACTSSENVDLTTSYWSVCQKSENQPLCEFTLSKEASLDTSDKLNQYLLIHSTLRRSNCWSLKVIRVVWIENKSFPAIEGFPLQPWCSSVSGSDPNWGAAPRKKFSGAKIIAEFINFDLLLLLKIKTNVKEYALVGPWGQKEGDPASWWFK